MPIKFRCPHCQQFLGISRSKAGAVTDCPTCGRTIRIPNLDGQVAPLPAPRFDAQDDQLVAALGALASIPQEDQPVAEDAAALAAAPEVVVQKAVVAVVPEVVPPPLDELEVVAEPVPNVEDASEFSLIGEEDALAQLGKLRPATTPNRTQPQKGPRFGAAVLLLVSVASAASGALMTWGLLRGQVRTVAKPAVSPAVAVAQPVATPPAKAEVAGPQIRGEVSYVAPGGSLKPDHGARVLVLPLVRQGSAKIVGTGFRVGADAVDRQLLAASAEALGGELQLADDAGRFMVELASPGEYGVLIASRYQSRPEQVPLPERCQQFLAQYFERPDLMIGNVQYRYQQLTVAAAPSEPLKVEFPMP